MSNRLPVLAGLIREAHHSVQTAARLSADRAIDAGHLLIEAKGAVGHGNWLTWLREHVRISERTARGYMQLARSGLKSATVAEMGLRRALGSIAKPKPMVMIPDPEEIVIGFSRPPHKHQIWLWREGPDGFCNLMAIFGDNRRPNFYTFKRPFHLDGLSTALLLTGFDLTDCHWEDFTGTDHAVSLRTMHLAGDRDGISTMEQSLEEECIRREPEDSVPQSPN